MKINRKELEKDLQEIYTPLSVAREEIQRRWNDKELEKKMKVFLQGDVPDFLQEEPKAYMARHIASPNFECIRFLKLAEKINLSPVIPEFRDDKFVFINPVKYYLANLRVAKGDCDSETMKIVDENCFNGKKVCDTETLWGERLMEFHHRIFQNVFKIRDDSVVFDISDWLRINGRKSDKFYIHFLSLFIRNAVLFENFLASGEEGDMFRNIILPSFKKVEEIFGCKPLVVQLLPGDSEQDLHWYSYGSEVAESVPGKLMSSK
jgi:hypothetical protein